AISAFVTTPSAEKAAKRVPIREIEFRDGRKSSMNRRWLNSTVFGIGLASLFSDLSHETVTSILPALLASMGAAAGALGTIEGVADGASSIAKLYGGWLTDRFQRKKALCAAGYGTMALATGVIATASA